MAGFFHVFKLSDNLDPVIFRPRSNFPAALSRASGISQHAACQIGQASSPLCGRSDTLAAHLSCVLCARLRQQASCADILPTATQKGIRWPFPCVLQASCAALAVSDRAHLLPFQSHGLRAYFLTHNLRTKSEKDKMCVNEIHKGTAKKCRIFKHFRAL